jgi:uncharacterized protein
MLEIKPNCENCGKLLPNDSDEAMICSFECTFCKDCVSDMLANVCPNCGGGLEKRPIRPNLLLAKYPVGQREYLRPLDSESFKEKLAKYKDIEPRKR